MTLPNEVVTALQAIRETGQVNMLDREAVISFMGHASHEAAILRETDPNEWSTIIIETVQPDKPKQRGRKKKLDETEE